MCVMVVKTCKTHGPLTANQCFTHKHGPVPKYNRAARIDYECKICVLERAKTPKRKSRINATKKARYAADPKFRAKRLSWEADRYKRKSVKIRSNVKSWRRRLKIEAFTHYCGGRPKCASCPVDDLRFLCLDHVEEDGAAHRRKNPKYQRNPYWWVKRNGYPSGFQVLCHNCNVRKHRAAQGRGKSASARSLLKLKKEVLGHYSAGVPKCALCDENELDVLTVDHEGGGGNAHRRELGGKTTWVLYRWIRRTGFPTGFRVLCFNHNLGEKCLGL